MINDKIGQEIEKLAVSENLFSGAFFYQNFCEDRVHERDVRRLLR